MKDWLMKIANVLAWAIGIAIVVFLVCTGVYFGMGWHKRGKTHEGEGTVSNPNSDDDKLHINEISGAINTLWGQPKS